jgi:hypothetical protein
MSEPIKENIFEWIKKLDLSQQTLFFSHLARELTISFRAFSADEQLAENEKMKGMYAFNEIQHRILIRVLPARLIGTGDGDIIIDQILNLGSKDETLASYLGAALNSSRKKLLQ